MEFDKSKILTCVTADQAEVGQRGWFSNEPSLLMNKIQRRDALREILNIDFDNDYPFQEQPNDGSFACKYRYFYPAPESIKPTYRPFTAEELCTLVGKVVTNRLTGYPNLVTGVTNSGKSVFVGTSCVSASVLLDKFTLNGEPCGMKEEA